MCRWDTHTKQITSCKRIIIIFIIRSEEMLVVEIWKYITLNPTQLVTEMVLSSSHILNRRKSACNKLDFFFHTRRVVRTSSFMDAPRVCYTENRHILFCKLLCMYQHALAFCCFHLWLEVFLWLVLQMHVGSQKNMRYLLIWSFSLQGWRQMYRPSMGIIWGLLDKFGNTKYMR